jgi:ABC-2 type transport system ATP-binding protein
VDHALILNKVSKRFGTFTAVNELSFSVPKGCIFGLLGGNGAGKTTSIRMILDILKPSSGSIQLLGTDSATKVQKRIAYLPEERGLYKKMKVWKCAVYFATLKGMDSITAKAEAFELLDRYGLGDFKDKKVGELSKGMSQKVQLISTILHNPEFIILDEPFSGLDPVNQQSLEELIQDLARQGKTIIFSTHVMQHAERLCNQLLLMAKGNKVFEGSVAEAKATLPHRILLESDQDVSSLKQLESVTAMQRLPDLENQWELYLAQHSDPQQVLQACFDRGIRLQGFRTLEPTLHDVFVKLVGVKPVTQAEEAA